MTLFSIANADIAHQRVESEVIVINLGTGAYFSLRDAAADAWDLLIGGVGSDAAAAALAERYGVPPEAVVGDLGGFTSVLLGEGLIATGHPAPDATPVFGQLVEPAPYRPMTLDKFDDLEELLLLDPIHEVDEAGWPVIAAEPSDQ